MLYTVLRIAIKGEEHECNGQCIQTIFWLLERIIDSLEVRYACSQSCEVGGLY
jgi:hypothetical protein